MLKPYRFILSSLLIFLFVQSVIAAETVPPVMLAGFPWVTVGQPTKEPNVVTKIVTVKAKVVSVGAPDCPPCPPNAMCEPCFSRRVMSLDVIDGDLPANTRMSFTVPSEMTDVKKDDVYEMQIEVIVSHIGYSLLAYRRANN